MSDPKNVVPNPYEWRIRNQNIERLKSLGIEEASYKDIGILNSLARNSQVGDPKSPRPLQEDDYRTETTYDYHHSTPVDPKDPQEGFKIVSFYRTKCGGSDKTDPKDTEWKFESTFAEMKSRYMSGTIRREDE